MISIMQTRLGVLGCPAVVGYVGSGAKAVFGGGTGVSWVQRHVAMDRSAFFVRTSDPIPTGVNATRLSAPSERSP